MGTLIPPALVLILQPHSRSVSDSLSIGMWVLGMKPVSATQAQGLLMLLTEAGGWGQHDLPLWFCGVSCDSRNQGWVSTPGVRTWTDGAEEARPAPGASLLHLETPGRRLPSCLGPARAGLCLEVPG